MRIASRSSPSRLLRRTLQLLIALSRRTSEWRFDELLTQEMCVDRETEAALQDAS
jgi:hypothetical protein